MNRLLPWALAAALAGPVTLLHAQLPPAGNISARGSFELKKQPDRIHVEIEVFGKGVDLKEALAKLKIRRQSAQKFLEDLGVPPTSIEFSDPKITTEKTDRQQQMHMMMRRMQIQQGKPVKEKPKEPPKILVSSDLKAQVQLSAATAEELLMTSHKLEERIKGADLAGMKDLTHLTPQDDEQGQEEMDSDDGNDQQPKRGEPIFLYAARLTEDEYTKALAQAFKKAKRQAGQMAKAANVELGPLKHLDSDVAPDNYALASMQEAFMGNQFYYQAVQRMAEAPAGAGADKPTPEAIGIQPGKVVYRINLSAAFELGKPVDK
jgi:uncharacterized protein YggE